MSKPKRRAIAYMWRIQTKKWRKDELLADKNHTTNTQKLENLCLKVWKLHCTNIPRYVGTMQFSNNRSTTRSDGQIS